MAAPAAFMIGSSIVQGIASLFGASAEADAQRQQAEYNANVSEFNAKLSEMQTEDAYKRGDRDAQKLKSQAKTFKGTQRAKLAAQGIEVDSGSAAEIQEQTEVLSAQDAMTIKNNAAREAFGYKVQTMQYRQAAKYGMQAGENAARATMLGGGLRAVGSFGQAAAYAAGWGEK